jgi:hypothetical protein
MTPTRQAANRRARDRSKARMREAYSSVPQMPEDIAHEPNCLSEEQERTGRLVIEAATWALLEQRRKNQQRTREDARGPTEIRIFTVNMQYGSLIARSA